MPHTRDIYKPNGRPYPNAQSLPRYPIPTRELAFRRLSASADAIRAAGGPRGDPLFGGPDVEYSLRVARHGHALFYLPELRATHHPANYRRFWLLGSWKVPGGTPGHRYYVLRNRLTWHRYRRDGAINGIGKVIAREIAGTLLAATRMLRLRLLGQANRDATVGDPERKMP